MRKYGFLLLFFFFLSPLTAQNDCGLVDAINFPVDINAFTLAQDFGVASSRHQGRYHTGEDWYGGRGLSLGQPVHAIAKGRVTYSAPTGWGRDGGVVILEHSLSDGTIFFSQYGHIAESDSFSFPQRLDCLQMGDIIGFIDDVRPAPHLHFEIRVEGAGNGITAGAGYSAEIPYTIGLRNPSKFILNQQAWLSAWHLWHINVGTESPIDERGLISPPVPLSDESLLYLDGTGLTLRRATSDGRVLWRARLEKMAVAIMAWQGSSLLTYADGTMQLVDVEAGTLGESWRVEAQFTGSPLTSGNELLFPAINNELLRIAANRREIVGRFADIPSFTRAQLLPNGAFAIITAQNQFRYYAADGTLINQSRLEAMGSLATSWEGDLLAYTQGGLWRLNTAGEWSLYIPDAPVGSESSAILLTADNLYLFNGRRLFAYNRDLSLSWETASPPISGFAELSLYENILLLTTNHGNIVLFNAAGAYCNQGRIFGQDGARQWQELGTDGVLRLAIADQILGIDWANFSRPCRV